jgi:histidinol dehydrogenase
LALPVRKFDAKTWKESSQWRRQLDMSQFAQERAAVAEICARVATEGDAALRELGKKFDGWAPGPGESFEVPRSELADAAESLQPADRTALEFAAQRIRNFHTRQLPAAPNGPDNLRLITRPVNRAGVYAPGGRAAYPSTVLMTVVPARVANVPEVVLATPPGRDGKVARAILAGPGNIYVTLAKKEVFGSVGVDGIAGPTEVMVIADAKARPDFVAADLAAQLEHDPLASAVLITDSKELAERVEEELQSLVRGLERAEIIRQANCSLVVVDDLDEAIELANDFAPEHLLIVADDAEKVAARIESAGAVFVGPYATVPLGDYTAGPNHTLPTSGAARFSSPLGVHTFLKRTSVLSLDRSDLEMLRDASVRLAEMEGLGAHAHAIEVRLE